MKAFVTILSILAFTCTQAVFAQQPPVLKGSGGGVTRPYEAPPTTPELTRFDLDFPGGTAGDLVHAIEHASGKPLNMVIPTEAAKTELPPLKMRGVTVSELFQALESASSNTHSRLIYPLHGGAIDRTATYHFSTPAPIRDESVWSFSSYTSDSVPACRFWQLAPYLENYTVDDITTAISTAFKLLGEPAPTISFHKDTRLLIAVGQESRLQLIDSVLQQLLPVRKNPAVGGASGGTTVQPGKP
jgi:hypothetical protein